jgi:hypothetical protein
MSKAADTGAQSMRYGDSAAAITVTWLVIDKYRNAKAQPAITSATRPVAVWSTLRIFDNIVQCPSSARRQGAARRRSCSALTHACRESRRSTRCDRRIIRPRDRRRETWDDWDGLDSRRGWPEQD